MERAAAARLLCRDAEMPRRLECWGALTAFLRCTHRFCVIDHHCSDWFFSRPYRAG